MWLQVKRGLGESTAGRRRSQSAAARGLRLQNLRIDVRQNLLEGVPPCVFFQIRTLQALCLEQPGDLDTFGAISGVGERKREKYGPAFLAVILAHRS